MSDELQLTDAGATMDIPEPDMKAACDWAIGYARRRARESSEVEEVLIDAATDALMWSRANCKNATTFVPLAKAAIRRWFGRTLHRLKLRRSHRPEIVPITHDVAHRRVEQPTKPMLIEGLPEDLAFVVRLYMVDAYTCREISMLTGQSHDTVNRKSHRAAELLAGGRIKPERRNGEKRLSAGW